MKEFYGNYVVDGDNGTDKGSPYYEGKYECLNCEELFDESELNESGLCEICSNKFECNYCKETFDLFDSVETEDGLICRFCFNEHQLNKK